MQSPSVDKGPEMSRAVVLLEPEKKPEAEEADEGQSTDSEDEFFGFTLSGSNHGVNQDNSNCGKCMQMRHVQIQ